MNNKLGSYKISLGTPVTKGQVAGKTWIVNELSSVGPWWRAYWLEDCPICTVVRLARPRSNSSVTTAKHDRSTADPKLGEEITCSAEYYWITGFSVVFWEDVAYTANSLGNVCLKNRDSIELENESKGWQDSTHSSPPYDVVNEKGMSSCARTKFSQSI